LPISMIGATAFGLLIVASSLLLTREGGERVRVFWE